MLLMLIFFPFSYFLISLNAKQINSSPSAESFPLFVRVSLI